MRAVRVRFIVTGDLEKQALIPSLRGQFGTTNFQGHRVEWLPPQKVHGATTHRLRDGAAPSNSMRRLAKAALTEALVGADGAPSDLVVVVDDLELDNHDQVSVVCDHFRRALDLELCDYFQRKHALAGEQEDARSQVRRTCSFHLLSPMVESVLFGEPAALVRAGCGATVAPQLQSTDWEDFWCIDPSFLPTCQNENQKKANPPQPMPWWREERHAKHYLEHLIHQNNRSTYEETQHGARAFETLDWPNVPKTQAECPLVRALFEDLADFFGVQNPLGAGTASPHTYAGPTPRRRSPPALRNM